MCENIKKKFSDISKVVILPCGISSKKEKLKLKINTSNPLISTFSDHWDKGRFSDSKWDEEINVDTTTLDQLINDYGHPKYIKIDVEGFELEVLKGSENTLDYMDYVIAEISSTAIYENQTQADELIKFLESKSFEIKDRCNLSRVEDKLFQEDVLFCKS